MLPEGEEEGRTGAGLEVEMEFAAGAVRLDLRFRISASWTVLFAPSGAGKSTALRMIAGLERPRRGWIASIGRDGSRTLLEDTEARISIAAYRRGIGLVAQDPALFPHMSVRRNVTYGVDRRDGSGKGKAGRVEAVMAMCRIGELLGKMPAQISGGERQRVALARAIASEPERLLLLDEPFTGMDTELREALATDLQGWMRERGTPVLQVTHDLGDVLATGAEVLVMDGGRIVAQGPARRVLAGEMEHLRRQIEGEGTGR